jgi:putative SOS response-associated peptidase YedK
MTRSWYWLPGDEPFAVGGIWRPTDAWGNCYSMVMVNSCAQMEEVHDRMPAILRREDWATWLNTAPADAFGLCRTWNERLAKYQSEFLPKGLATCLQ